MAETGGYSTLARLAQALAARPDLAGVAPFWLAIYEVQAAARAELGASTPPRPWTVRRERLLAGRPQLDLDDLPLDAGALRRLAERLDAVWREHDPGRGAMGEVDWPALVREAFADPTLAFGQRPDLSREEAVAALTLAPYLGWASQAIGPVLEGELAGWGRGGCPVCGGHPDLAVLAGDPASRSLVCSRCNTGWPYRRVGCPFCHDLERQAYHAGDDARYRLYVCAACQRYVKTVVAPGTGGGLDPRVERLLSIGMDLAAVKAGYGPP
jgi:FdhE protein